MSPTRCSVSSTVHRRSGTVKNAALATIHLGGVSDVFYVGLGALILNVVIAAVVTPVVSQVWPARKAPA